MTEPHHRPTPTSARHPQDDRHLLPRPGHAPRLLATVLPVGDGAMASEAQLDELLGSVVERVVAGSGRLRADPPTAPLLAAAFRIRGATARVA
jgi:hypothetical protein